MFVNKPKKIDLIVIFLLAIVSSFFVVKFNAKFLVSSFVFLGVPAIYLIIRNTQNLRLIFPGVIFIGIIMGFVFDFLATLNKAWIIPQEQLIFPYRVFGAAPIDELICLILWTLLILLVYEHFFESRRTEILNWKHYLISGIFPSVGVLIIVVLSYFIKPQLIIFPYAYAILGFLSAIPLFYLIIKEPQVFRKVLYALPYFVLLFFLFEITALHLGQWIFPGQYFGHVNFFGYRFPFEEFFIWIIASSSIVLADYKLFVDSDKKVELVDGKSKSLEMCKEQLGKKVKIVIDQPYGTFYKNALYECNYGYIPGTVAPDGEGLDAYFIGPKEPLKTAEGICIAIIHRLDDDDDKLILVPEGVYMNDEEIEKTVNFREKFFKHEVIR